LLLVLQIVGDGGHLPYLWPKKVHSSGYGYVSGGPFGRLSVMWLLSSVLRRVFEIFDTTDL